VSYTFVKSVVSPNLIYIDIKVTSKKTSFVLKSKKFVILDEWQDTFVHLKQTATGHSRWVRIHNIKTQGVAEAYYDAEPKFQPTNI
jgi:hypothetical protein